MKGSIWRIVAALVLAVALVTGLLAVSHASGTGVSQVSVTGNATVVLPDEKVELSVTVLTGNSTESWSGNITVTDPGTTEHTADISGSGTTTVTKTYPDDFSGADTTATGSYSITAYGNVTSQSPVQSGTTSFEVKTWYLTVSPSRITPGSTVTVTVNTNDASWGGNITITEPSAGGSDTAWKNYANNSQNGTQTTGAFPGVEWTGSGNTTAVGVYTVTFDESTAGGVDDTVYFDVQDDSPHPGTFSVTTDACAACHRTHTALAPKLLAASSQYALCISCHDGSGANTKVTTGVYLGSTQGTQNAGLRGGGFTEAYMDTNANGTAVSDDITSRHTIGATATAWGSGASSSSSGETVSLECGNCHNPHGNNAYRILRPKPTSLAAWSGLTAVDVDDEGTTNYSISYDYYNYRDLGQYDTATLDDMSDWCGQCHTRYDAGAGSGSTPATDPNDPFLYRHMTDGLGGECLKCHVAHGTTASMSNYAAGPTWPDGSSTASWQTGTEGEYSRLLHVDNRGVCIQCHTSSSLTQN